MSAPTAELLESGVCHLPGVLAPEVVAGKPAPPRYAEVVEQEGRRIEVKQRTTGVLVRAVLSAEPLRNLLLAALGDDAECLAAGTLVAMSSSSWSEWSELEGRGEGGGNPEASPWRAEGTHLFDVDVPLPPYALTCYVPLNDLTPENGPAEFARGSHVPGREYRGGERPKGGLGADGGAASAASFGMLRPLGTEGLSVGEVIDHLKQADGGAGIVEALIDAAGRGEARRPPPLAALPVAAAHQQVADDWEALVASVAQAPDWQGQPLTWSESADRVLRQCASPSAATVQRRSTLLARAGDAVVVDYRLWRRWLPNRSDADQQLLYAVVGRPWWGEKRGTGEGPESLFEALSAHMTVAVGDDPVPADGIAREELLRRRVPLASLYFF
ncbi:hypothetical protein EMIHUDRAFT_236792 [Emiliania huxleyi CCMP1516]|uniref:DUSP domain-containing protein n=3 Tax=Emiliania huxleyi TaxID=2903 RepID=A0A0D3JS23_EMIH1|nr:hypothetical protein EMIHUDRAFT_236792 [Emiliania huxleyi CCMP1516]EOD26308.1 hypothetical protein EMIHUDRAFT_236792 [Emiliania huxleyi CCMP1516]|eukprot:XP_005778737.1 hypothetical protein EMIHUDRAFT_236792 [Emiliania huxleyi CCMP1516]